MRFGVADEGAGVAAAFPAQGRAGAAPLAKEDDPGRTGFCRAADAATRTGGPGGRLCGRVGVQEEDLPGHGRAGSVGRVENPPGDLVDGLVFHADEAVEMQGFAGVSRFAAAARDDQGFFDGSAR